VTRQQLDIGSAGGPSKFEKLRTEGTQCPNFTGRGGGAKGQRSAKTSSCLEHAIAKAWDSVGTSEKEAFAPLMTLLNAFEVGGHRGSAEKSGRTRVAAVESDNDKIKINGDRKRTGLPRFRVEQEFGRTWFRREYKQLVARPLGGKPS